MGKFVIVGNFAIVDREIANSAKMELSENLRLSENYISGKCDSLFPENRTFQMPPNGELHMFIFFCFIVN